MQRAFLAVTMTLALVCTACAKSSVGAGGGPNYSTDPGRVVVRVSTGGGFVAPSTTLTQLPQFSLMGDGRAITPGAIPEIYPGPAIAPLVSQSVTPDGISAILARASADVLLGPSRDYTDMASVGMADLPTTTITVVADGKTHTFNFYGLGELQKKPDAMSPAEYDVRTKAQDFVSHVGNLDWLPSGSVGASTPFLPTGVSLYVGPYRADRNLTEPPISWPLTPGLANFGGPARSSAASGALNTGTGAPPRCGVVTGPDFATLWPLIQKANQLTPWQSGGKEYGLLFRPMLPDGSGC